MGPNEKKELVEETEDIDEFENEEFLTMTMDDETFAFESADYYDEEIYDALVEEERAILSKYGY